MKKIILILLSLYFAVVSNLSSAASPISSKQIIAIQGEVGEVHKLNLLRFFSDTDDREEMPTTMKFSSTGMSDWISIDGVDIKISAKERHINTITTIKVTATDQDGSIAYQNVKIVVPNGKAANPNFPLINIPYIYSGGYVVHEGVNDSNPIVIKRIDNKASKINCSALMEEIPSISEISSGVYAGNDYAAKYYKYMFPKSGSILPITIPWSYMSENNNYEELFKSADATDEYKKIMQQNQICEIKVLIESGERFSQVYAESYSENSPDNIDKINGLRMASFMSSYADKLLMNVEKISNDGYGDTGYSIGVVSEAISTYKKDFLNFSSLMCSVYNGGYEGEMDIFMKSSSYSEDPSFFNDKIERVKKISNGSIDITQDEKDQWKNSCMNVPDLIPRAHPQGRGIESAKALYSLGYRNIPQTKDDGEYDMGIQNLDFDRGNQKTTHFASIKKGAKAYMSGGIQNGPSKFQFEENPRKLEKFVHDLVYDDMKSHNNFNAYVGNKSSNPDMKGIVMMPTTGPFGSGAIPVTSLYTAVNTDTLLLSSDDEAPKIVDNSKTKIDGWDDSSLVKDFLNNSSVGMSYSILDLYNMGYNWDNGKCTQGGDSSCLFAFSLYLNDDKGGMYLKPVSKTSGGGHAAVVRTIGSPLIKENQLAETKEMMDTNSGLMDIVGGYLDVGKESSLEKIKGKAIKSDMYYSLTYDQMASGPFGYELDGLGILLPPGYFYSGEKKRLNTYSFLQLKTPRYSKTDAGYNSYIFTDGGDDLLNSTNTTGKSLISNPRITPTPGYCKGLGLDYLNGNCEGDPCKSKGLKFNKVAGVCEIEDSNFDIDSKDSMCVEPPMFKPTGVEELVSSINQTKKTGGRLHQTIKEGGYCKTTIPVKRLPTSCMEIKEAQPNSRDGEYIIFLGDKKTKVYCDMDTKKGGWTLAIRDSDGIVPSSCAWCHMDNVWPGSDLVNPDLPNGDLVFQKKSKGHTYSLKNPYKGLPFYTMKPSSILYKSYLYSNNPNRRDGKGTKEQFFSGTNKYGYQYNSLSEASAPTKDGNGPILSAHGVKTYEERENHRSHYWEEMYVRDDTFPIKIKEVINTPDRWSAYTRNQSLPDPRDGGDYEYYQYSQMPPAKFPYLTTALQAGESDRAGGKYVLLVEAMDRIDTNWDKDAEIHPGRNIRVKVVISEPGNYNYKFAIIHQSDSPDPLCKKKPYVEIKTQEKTYKTSKCIKDIAPEETTWINGTFRTTKINEEVIVTVHAVAERQGDWGGTRFVIPFDQADVNFNDISISSLSAINLCGSGYSLTANLEACEHIEYISCPIPNTQLITNNGITTCGKLPDSCSVSELEIKIDKKIDEKGNTVIKREYGKCSFPAFAETSIDVIKNISSRIFYNKFIKENNGLITPADLNGLEISSEYKDILIEFEKDLNKKGESIWDMDHSDGSYLNLNTALSRSSDYVDAADLKRITDSYDIDNKSKKRFVRSVGILKENLPEFAVDALAISYGIMAHRIRDLPVEFGSKVECKDGEIEAYDSAYERVCVVALPSIDDVSKYKWNSIEQGQGANFKLEIEGDSSKLTLGSTKSIVMDFGNSIPISSNNLAELILDVMDKDISGKGESLIRSVISCNSYKVNTNTPIIMKDSDKNYNGKGSIYGSIDCKPSDSSYSNIAISRFNNIVETDETSNLEDLYVRSELGVMEENSQIKTCREDVGGSDRFGGYNFTTWSDSISKQEYEKKGNFKSSINLYMPKKLTNSYIRERETNRASREAIERIVGLVEHGEDGDLLKDDAGLVFFNGRSGVFSSGLTDTGSSVVANQINEAVQGSFPYKSTNIPINISTDIFNDDMGISKEGISSIANFTNAIDSKVIDGMDSLKSIFLSEDSFIGVRNDIVNGYSYVAEYSSEVIEDEKVIAIKMPRFKKALKKDLSDNSSILGRLKAVFPEECSHLKVDGYKDKSSYVMHGEYSDINRYVSTSKENPEYKDISNFLMGPEKKEKYVYFGGYGYGIKLSEKIHLDEEVELTFEQETKKMNELTRDATHFYSDKGGLPKLISNIFTIANIDSPTQQEITCKVVVDGVCEAGDKILNGDIGNYYYTRVQFLEPGVSAIIDGEDVKIKSGDKLSISKGDIFNLVVTDIYTDMVDFKVTGTSDVLGYTSELPESINNPQYHSIYYKDTLEKFADIDDLYFSRFNGGELSISFDKGQYDNIDPAVRKSCDLVYGYPKISDDGSSYSPSVSASISDEMVVDYQLVDILSSEESSKFVSDEDIIADTSILSQLKCTVRGLRVNGNVIRCDSSFEKAIKFSKFEIRDILNGNVILEGEGFVRDEDSTVETSLGRMLIKEGRENVNFVLSSKIKLDSITERYEDTDVNKSYDILEDNLLGLISEVLSYNPDYRLYIKPQGFDKYSTGIGVSFNFNIDTDITNISSEMEVAINIANDACLSVSNFDQSIVDEMAEKNKFYMVMKSMLDMNGVTDELKIPGIQNLGSQLKMAKETQRYRLFKGWSGKSQGDIAVHYKAEESAEAALMKYLDGECRENNNYLSDAMEPGITNPTGLFCKLKDDFLFYPGGGDNYVFEPEEGISIGVKVEIPSYKTFDFGGAKGFGSSRLTALVNKRKMHKDQGLDFWKKTHNFLLNSRNNIYTQVMKGVALHEFEYKKQMAGIVNNNFLGECVSSLSSDGIYKANMKDISLKRAFSGNRSGIRTLIPAVLRLDDVDSYNDYNPISSIVQTDIVSAGFSVASQGNGHVENNKVKLYKTPMFKSVNGEKSNPGLYNVDAEDFCRNIMEPRVLVGNDYIDAANLEVLTGGSSLGSAIVSVKVPRAVANLEDNNEYNDFLSNPNWLQDKVCKDGYEEVGIRLDKRKLISEGDKCDGGINSGLCAQEAPPTFGFFDAIMALFGSKAIQREVNEYNNNGIMKIVKICGIGSEAGKDIPFSTPISPDTVKRKIVILNDGRPTAVYEGNVLLGDRGVDKAKLNIQVLYSDIGLSDEEVNTSQRSLVINSINLFNTITNKKTGKDRSLGYTSSGSDGFLSLDNGSPLENVVNSCIKFKGKFSYRKVQKVTGFKLDSSYTNKSGSCSVSPRDNLDIYSCNKAKGKWVGKVPLVKVYVNAKKDFSFVDPRNGQQRSVRSCSDIFLENEEVFNENKDGSDVSKEKRDSMVRNFQKSITGCSGAGNILNEEEAKKKAEEIRKKKMTDLVLTCGINSSIETNPDASELLAKELSSFETVSSGSYTGQSEDGLFVTRIGKDKGSSLGALKNNNFKTGDFTETPTGIDASSGEAQGLMENLEKSSAKAGDNSSFTAGLTALSSILDVVGAIPGIPISSGMVDAVDTTVRVAEGVSIVNMVKDIKDAKNIAAGGAAVNAANNMQNDSLDSENNALSSALMGFNEMTVGEYVDKVIKFDQSMLKKSKSQDKEQEMDEHRRLRKEYESKRSDAEDRLYGSNNSLGNQLEGKVTIDKYKHEGIKIRDYGEMSSTDYYKEMQEEATEDGAEGSAQTDYYRMRDREYRNIIAPGALSRLEQEDEDTVEDENIKNIYGNFTIVDADSGVNDFKGKSDDYNTFIRNQKDVTSEGFSQ